MSDSAALYTACAEVLSLCQSRENDLEALLDAETGFAPRLREICNNQILELEEEEEEAMQEELEALRMERNTWGLLQALMSMRKTDPSPLPSASTLLLQNPYTPTSTLAQAIMNASPLLSELIAVREWLHDTASPPLHPEATTGYWKFTKHTMLQALRTSTGRDKYRDGLVKAMDPDAPGREEGRTLAADDMSYERGLSQALYTYVRAGRLEDAVDLCRKAHQPWRAASIRGSLLFQWRAIANEPNDEDAMDYGEDDLESWQGNRQRKLWKSTCTSAALNAALSDSERVLYASLVPTPQTSTILKSACRTWEDHLWVQISIMCEEKQSAEMHRLRGGFWEGGLTAVEKGDPISTLSPEEQQAEEEEWEREVMGTLESLESVQVEDGPPADNAFHISQLHIILDRTDALLQVFADGLRDDLYDTMSPSYPTMTRFFAHLCLFLQMIDIPVPPLAIQNILEAYLQVLEAAGQRDLIALYAGALGDNAVERYSMFLTSLELSVDADERRAALLRARDHGLDVDRVAIATAERTIEKSFDLLPSLKGPLPSVLIPQTPPSDAELFLLRSIEWTTFMESTHETALEQTNVILRYILASGRVHVAKLLLDMLPPELASFAEPAERAKEYVHYRQFFTIWETFDRVVECSALELSMDGQGGAKGVSRETRAAWLQDYIGLIDQASEQVLKLLTSEWLVSDVEEGGGDRRRRELIRVRAIYIPELIIRLHAVLYTSRHRFPKNLVRALELANIVADARYKLYEDFSSWRREHGGDGHGRRLGDYLGAVRQAVLAGLERGGSDPFRAVRML